MTVGRPSRGVLMSIVTAWEGRPTRNDKDGLEGRPNEKLKGRPGRPSYGLLLLLLLPDALYFRSDVVQQRVQRFAFSTAQRSPVDGVASGALVGVGWLANTAVAAGPMSKPEAAKAFNPSATRLVRISGAASPSPPMSCVH